MLFHNIQLKKIWIHQSVACDMQRLNVDLQMEEKAYIHFAVVIQLLNAENIWVCGAVVFWDVRRSIVECHILLPWLTDEYFWQKILH